MAINFLLKVLNVFYLLDHLAIYIEAIYQAYIDGPEGAEPSPRLGE
jgi:hypothetical protein